ncbi:MAG: biotin/lipoyl-containing protein [Candidatus Heimdallarchaeaceae archaeon]
MSKKKVMFRDKEYIIEILPNGEICIDEEIFSAEVKQGINSIYKVDVDGHTFTIEVSNDEYIVNGEKAQFTIKPYIPVLSTQSSEEDKRDIKISAPIPGKITKILVKKGEEVSKDQELLILEAMKMRNRIFAPSSGKILKISVKENDNVVQDQHLLVIQP